MTTPVSIQNPIPSIDWINNPSLISRFPGIQNHPITGKYIGHAGLDIRTPIGTQIISPAENGIVKKIGWDVKFEDGKKVGYGRYVDIDYKITNSDGSISNVTTRYAHLEKNGVQVKVGDVLNAGQNIATTGNSGGSTGPHLHYEVIVDGKRVDARTVTNLGNFGQPLSLPIDSQGFLLDSHGNRLLLADSGQIATDGYYTTDKNSTTNNSNSTNPLDSADNQLTNPLGDNTNSTNDNQSQSDQEKAQDQIIKDALASEDAKQTATFMGELQSQLPSMMGIMAARLAMGEDIKLVSADMASRLIATSAINTYAENHWAENGGRSSLEASTANAVASYAVTILITNAFSGDNMNREDYKLAAMNISIQTITSEVVKYVGQTAIRESAKAAGYTTTAQITQYVTLNAYQAAIASGATEAAAKAAGEKAASQFGAISPAGAGVVAAITYIGMSIARDGMPQNQEAYEDMAANAASAASCAMIGAAIGTAIFPGVGTVAGLVIGAIIGILISIVAGGAFTNLYNSNIDDTKEWYHSSADGYQEIFNGNVSGVEDILRADAQLVISYIQAIGHFFENIGQAIGSLFGRGDKAPPPPPLFQIIMKDDGTGQIIYSLHDGYTIISRDSFADDANSDYFLLNLKTQNQVCANDNFEMVKVNKITGGYYA